MDLRFVETLLLVVDHGSLAEAARRQGITAAAATQRVAALEAELNVPLLARDGRRMAPTPDCEVLVPDMRRMVALRLSLPGLLAQERLEGHMRFGAVSTALSDFGPQLVQALEREAPAVDLTLIPGAAAQVFQQFERGDVDAALIVAPPFSLPKTIRFDVVARQRIGFVRRADAPRDVPFLLYSREAWGGALCWQALRTQVADPRVRCEMDALEIIAQMVSDGLGQAVLPAWGGLDRHFPTLQFEPIADVYRDIGLLTWRRDMRRPLVQLVQQSLASQPV